MFRHHLKVRRDNAFQSALFEQFNFVEKWLGVTTVTIVRLSLHNGGMSVFGEACACYSTDPLMTIVFPIIAWHLRRKTKQKYRDEQSKKRGISRHFFKLWNWKTFVLEWLLSNYFDCNIFTLLTSWVNWKKNQLLGFKLNLIKSLSKNTSLALKILEKLDKERIN